MILAESMQPQVRVFESKITSELDRIAERVKDLMKEKNPKHPLFLVPRDTVENWRTEELENNTFNGEDSNEILLCLQDVMFNEMGFQAVYEDSPPDYLNLDIFYIEKVTIVLLLNCPVHYLSYPSAEYTGLYKTIFHSIILSKNTIEIRVVSLILLLSNLNFAF